MTPRIFLSLLALCLTVLLPAQEELHREYIDLYKKIAIQEMERTGIPASIKLAQGLLESNAGTSELAAESNNHFGIKCGGDWTGTTYFLKDDDYDNDGNLLHSCFRVYKSPEESFIAHSDFLKNPKKEYRYGSLFKIKRKNYKKWARGLKKAGYATSKTYDKKLIKLIERYKLYQYDKMTATDVIAEEKTEDKKQNKNTEIAKIDSADDNYLDIVSPTKAEEEVIKRKEDRDSKKKYRNTNNGDRDWHFVEAGENLEEIAKKYDLKLSKLRRRNRLKKGQEPAIGERLKLRGKKVRTAPELRSKKNIQIAKPEKKKVEKPAVVKVEKPAPKVDEPKKEEQLASAKPVKIPAKSQLTSTAQKAKKETTNDKRLLDMDQDEAIDFTKVEAPKKKLPSQNNSITEEKAQYEELTPEPTIEAPKVEEPKVVVKEETKPLEEGGTYYVVQKGDTLWSIALKHRTTVEDVLELNKLKDSKIRRGMKLRVK